MALSPRTAVLYAADVTALEDADLYAACRAAVTPERRAKADRFRFAKDRRLCLAAELLLRHGLRETGAGDVPLIFEYGARGKPVLKESGIRFSVSHSGCWAVCALAEYDVGCDAEEIRPIDLKLARRFHPDERADILARPTEEERLELFYRYWTLKESFMKATGLGMALPLDEFRICRDGEITVTQTVDERKYSFREFNDIPGCCCALCAAGDSSGAALHIVDVGKLLNGEVSG